jgi:hypothetical protein
MPEVELLATGEGDYRLHAPDTLRAWMRHRTRRVVVDQTTSAADAVARPAPPAAGELEILRDHIDPARTLIGRTAKR